MLVLITGANGMLARALAKHCVSIGDNIAALTREGFNITDPEFLKKFFTVYKPDVLINCAAYTDVDRCETKIEKCIAVNAFAIENLASACKRENCGFITVSTDYVFDGENPGFYTEEDAPNPLSVYGKAKLNGEARAFNTYDRSIVVRSGWIFGEGGTNFLSRMPEFLSEGKPVKAVSDSFGTPTYANDLAVRLRELAEINKPGLYHVANSGEGASFQSFAEKLCEIKGYDKNLIEPVTSSELGRPAPRPRSSKLTSAKLKEIGLSPLRHWEKALEEFVSEKD